MSNVAEQLGSNPNIPIVKYALVRSRLLELSKERQEAKARA